MDVGQYFLIFCDLVDVKMRFFRLIEFVWLENSHIELIFIVNWHEKFCFVQWKCK